MDNEQKAKAALIRPESSESGQKLVRFLENRCPGVPRSAIMRWIRTGQVRVNKKRSKPFDRVGAEDTVRVPPCFFAEKIPDTGLAHPEVVYRQEDYAVLYKPSGLVAHGGTGHADSLDARLKAHFHSSGFSPSIAHRLDKPTSGLVLAGLTYEGLSRLAAMMKNREIGKFYLAWVAGKWEFSSPLVMEDELEKVQVGQKEKVVSGRGRKSRAVAEFLRREKNSSLVRLDLATGRTHQLRVQLADRGHPIVGDIKYGGPKCGQGLLLHAYKLVLPDKTHVKLPAWRGEYTVLPDDLK